MKLLSPLLKILDQLRVYHWSTDVYSRHKAYDKAYEELSDLVDSFVEMYLGKYGSTQANITYKFSVENDESKSIQFLDECVQFFLKLNDELSTDDVDLLNLRDEMVGVINRLKYLLSLK